MVGGEKLNGEYALMTHKEYANIRRWRNGGIRKPEGGKGD